MDKFILLAVVIVLLWISLKVARFFMRMILFAAIIAAGLVAYFVYLR